MKSTSKNTVSAKLSSRKIKVKENEGVVVPSLKVEADYKITGKYGTKKGVIECACFVKQFGQLLHMMFGGLALYSVKNTAGVIQTPNTLMIGDIHTLRCTAAAGIAAYGTVIGLDNTPVDITDYSLVSQCNHGSGTNEFSYGGPVSFNMSSDDSSNSLIITRTFANNSGSSIVVKEIGLIVYDSAGYFLILRDIISDPGFTVLATEELTINYKIKATV